MEPMELVTWVRASPFVPFRMRMIDGRTFEVLRPEELKVGERSMIRYGYRGDATDFFDRCEMLSPQWVESVEPIDAAQTDAT